MYPFDRLSSMSKAELQQIWQTIDESYCRCFAHRDPSRDEETEEAYTERTDWESAVLAEMTRRNLPTQIKESEPLTCPTCDTEVDVVDGQYGDLFAVCTKCNTHRRFGDHINCSFGPIKSGLPEVQAA